MKRTGSWLKLEGRGHSHPKVIAAGNGAYGAWCRMGQWCAEWKTNGVIPGHMVRTFATETEIDRLLTCGKGLGPGGADKVGLLEVHDEEHYKVHDFLDYNLSAAEWEALSQTKAEAGRKGARARWGDGTKGGTCHSSRHGTSNGTADAPAMALPSCKSETSEVADAAPTAKPPKRGAKNGISDGTCHGTTDGKTIADPDPDLTLSLGSGLADAAYAALRAHDILQPIATEEWAQTLGATAFDYKRRPEDIRAAVLELASKARAWKTSGGAVDEATLGERATSFVMSYSRPARKPPGELVHEQTRASLAADPEYRKAERRRERAQYDQQVAKAVPREQVPTRAADVIAAINAGGRK